MALWIATLLLTWGVIFLLSMPLITRHANSRQAIIKIVAIGAILAFITNSLIFSYRDVLIGIFL